MTWQFEFRMSNVSYFIAINMNMIQ